MKAHKLPTLTVKEYIDHEIESNNKYEYHNGKIFALAGGTVNHGKISGNVYSDLRNKLKSNSSNCLPFNSDVKLFIKESNSYVYPDTMVVCEDEEQNIDNENSIDNPILIIEVLSKSTAEYDRGDKFHLYRKVPTFKEYILIEQKKYVVDVHYKNDNSDLWRITRYEGLDKVVKLQSINIEISMKDIYYSTNVSSID